MVEKIIRKRLERPEVDFTPDTYASHITDLIGVRALHLFKVEWRPIHEFVTRTWDLHEAPLAYIRKGDRRICSKNSKMRDVKLRNTPRDR